MFSPERGRKTAEHDPMINNSTPEGMLSSPLRVFSPIIDVIRSNQTKATRDFDRFYGNLTNWVNLTPRTASNRIRKQTPEITAKMRQRRQDTTSLTPLLERHSIRESKKIIPSPPRFLIETPDSQMQELTPYKTPAQRSRLKRISDTTTPPTTQSSRLVQMWLDEESRRIKRIQDTLLGIKRQTSLLAEDSITKHIPFNLPGDDDDDFSILSPSDRYHINNNHNNNTLTTPLNESPKYPTYKRHRLNVDLSPMHEPFSIQNETSHIEDDILTTPTPTQKKLKPVKPAKLVRTPSSSSSVQDRFWKEIHHLDERKTKCRIDHWASDEQFWSDQSSNAPVASKLNYRLYKIAREERNMLEQRMDYE